MNSGHWTNQEKKKYYKYISFYKINNTNKLNYKILSFIIKTRTKIQIRSFHQKEYKKIVNDANLLYNLRYN